MKRFISGVKVKPFLPYLKELTGTAEQYNKTFFQKNYIKWLAKLYSIENSNIIILQWRLILN